MNKSQLGTLEAKGVETVLHEMAQGHHGSPGSQTRSEVEAWLQAKRLESEASNAAKRHEREEGTLAIAEKANRLASEANSIARLEAAAAARSARWAKYAAIIAALSAIAAILVTMLTRK
jgi:hypothetical protein